LPCLTPVTKARHFLDHENRCVRAHDVDGSIGQLPLAPRAYDLPQSLVDHAGRLITHGECQDARWRNVHIQPEVLKTPILAIRPVRTDDPERPRFTENRRGRSYRFIAPVLTALAETFPQ